MKAHAHITQDILPELELLLFRMGELRGLMSTPKATKIFGMKVRMPWILSAFSIHYRIVVHDPLLDFADERVSICGTSLHETLYSL